MNYLLDTCIISEVIKKKPQNSVIEWLNNVPENQLFLSILSLGEIQKGVSRLEESPRKKELQRWLQEDLVKRFENRILNLDLQTALKWGEVLGFQEKNGIKIPVIDSLLAATALLHELVIVTRNSKDMAKTGVQIHNPWEIE